MKFLGGGIGQGGGVGRMDRRSPQVRKLDTHSGVKSRETADPQPSGLDGECRGWALSPHNWWAVTAAVSMTWVLREQRWKREDVANV